MKYFILNCFRKELERCKPLDSGEIAGLVDREVGKERARVEAIVEQHAQRLSEQQKAYKSLEDEFRMALRIEAGRYQEVCVSVRLTVCL